MDDTAIEVLRQAMTQPVTLGAGKTWTFSPPECTCTVAELDHDVMPLLHSDDCPWVRYDSFTIEYGPARDIRGRWTNRA